MPEYGRRQLGTGFHKNAVDRQHARSSESPLHRSSSMFFVMILVTSCSSPFNVSRFEPVADADAEAVRVSLYNRAVFDMKVSVVEHSQMQAYS